MSIVKKRKRIYGWVVMSKLSCVSALAILSAPSIAEAFRLTQPWQPISSHSEHSVTMSNPSPSAAHQWPKAKSLDELEERRGYLVQDWEREA